MTDQREDSSWSETQQTFWAFLARRAPCSVPQTSISAYQHLFVNASASYHCLGWFGLGPLDSLMRLLLSSSFDFQLRDDCQSASLRTGCCLTSHCYCWCSAYLDKGSVRLPWTFKVVWCSLRVIHLCSHRRWAGSPDGWSRLGKISNVSEDPWRRGRPAWIASSMGCLIQQLIVMDYCLGQYR